MPSLANNDRVQVGVKPEGTYPAGFGVVPAGNGFLMNVTGESLKFDLKTDTSKALRPDGQVTDLVVVGAGASGGLNIEHVYKDLDWALEAVAQGTWSVYGTGGLSAPIASMTVAANDLTAAGAPTGVDAFTTLAFGQWFSVIPAAAASTDTKLYFAGRAFRVSTTVAPTSSKITLHASTPIASAYLGVLSNARITSRTVKNATTMRSFALEVAHTDIGQFRVHRGMVPSKISLSLGSGALVTGSIEFMGKDAVVQSATAMGASPAAASAFTPANAVKGVFDLMEGGSSLSATTFIKKADIDIGWDLRGQEAISVLGNAGIGTGKFNVKLKLETYFADATLFNKFLNNQASSLTIPVLDPDGNGYVYHFPRIKYSAAGANAGGTNQDTMLSLEATGLMDTDSTSPTFGCTVAIYKVGA